MTRHDGAPWPPALVWCILAMLIGSIGLTAQLSYRLGRSDERRAAAAAVSASEPDGTAVAELGAETTCCPRFRAPQQEDLDALTAAGGSLSVYVDEGGSCATLWHNGQPIRGYAGHPLDAARGCLEAWIAEGGGR